MMNTSYQSYLRTCGKSKKMEKDDSTQSNIQAEMIYSYITKSRK
jgi:hypothetical protein